MAKRVNVAAGEAVGFNMTPMIDCVFQLIIFFILTGQVANDAYAKDVQVVRPEDSMAIPASVAKFPNKVTVNVVSKAAGEADPDPVRASMAGFYQINTNKFDVGKWDEMIEIIRLRKREFKKQFGDAGAPAAGDGSKGAGQFFLEVRSDERVNWEYVAPVIRAGVEAGISKLNITALVVQK